MLIYIHPKCSTCKDALRLLEEQHLTFETKDITQLPPSIEELQAMLAFQNGNLKKLLNTSGQLYREMELSKKIPDMSEHEVLTLLSHHGMLVKRPFLLAKNFGLVGFNPTLWLQEVK